jgi:HlyD family secretion protein
MTKKTRYSIAAALILASAGGLWWYKRAEAADLPSFRYATVDKTNLQSTVSATGALNAVTTVQVGTQVSGQVSAIFADFNQRVKKGELLARIDPTLQQQAVSDAQAQVERNQAEVDEAQRELDRNKQLFDRKVLTTAEYNTSQYKLAVATANLKSSKVALARAQKNLGYTAIYAPIDGVVIERNVDVGQTVAASLQAPQIFLIANDLSQMQILASVDESDIGAIHEGQVVRFTVQPYPDEKFSGTVKQVRLQSTTTENVVHYTVVVAVQNTTGKLLPGMTATVDFITGEADSAFVVPNAALRFKPTGAMLAAAGVDSSILRTANPASSNGASASGSTTGVSSATPQRSGGQNNGPPGTGTQRAPRSAPRTTSGGRATLWYLAEGRTLRPLRVRLGISDGQRTVVTGDGLSKGMQIIVGTQTSAAATGTNTSPFQSTSNQGGPRRPGF